MTNNLWITLSQKLPRDGKDCVVLTNDDKRIKAYYDSKAKWFYHQSGMGIITGVLAWKY